MFKNRIECPLKCEPGNPKTDSQKHLLQCTKLSPNHNYHVKIEYVYADIVKQEQIGKCILKIIRERNILLDEMEHDSLPGEILDQSTLMQGAAAIQYTNV